MWTKKRFLHVCVFVFVLILGGCSNKAVSESDSQQTEVERPSEATIEIWELVLDNNPWATPMFEAAAKASGLNEQVMIVQKRVDPRVYYNQLIPDAIEKNEGPILFFSYSPDDIARFQKTGNVFPINHCLETYPEFQESVPEKIWNEVTFDGNVMGFPVAIQHPNAMFYNKKMLSELGWSQEEIEQFPERIATGAFTFSDFVDTAILATELGVVEPGFSFGAYSSAFMPAYLVFENQVHDEELKRTLHPDVLVQFLTLYRDLFEKGLVQEQFLLSAYNSWTTRMLFNDSVSHGRFLFWTGSTHLWELWSHSFANELGGEAFMLSHFGVTMMPAISSDVPLIIPGYARYYGILVSDQQVPSNLEEICRFFVEVVTTDINALHSPLSGQLSVADVNLAPSVALQNQDPYTSQTRNLLPYTQFRGLHSYYPWDVLREYSGRVINGELTPEEAADLAILEMQNEFGSELVVK